MGTFKPTKSQAEAVYDSFGGNVSVSAGAGSGKTEVLVQRFCRIVEEGLAGIDEILTVTFTEKAAKEMKERIVKRFSKLAEERGGERLEAALRGIESVHIGTIHSFATRVVRENAFEAGVGPNVSVLAEAETAMLKNSVLDEMIAKNSVAGDTHFLSILKILQEQSLRKSILKLYGHFSGLGVPISYAVSAYTANEDIDKEVQEYFNCIEKLECAADTEKSLGKLTEPLGEFLEAFPAIKSQILVFANNLRQLSAAEYTQTFDWSIFDLLKIIKKCVDGTIGPKEFQKNYVKPTNQAGEALLKAILAPVCQFLSEGIINLTVEFDARYSAAKHEAGSVDFDDLLNIAQRLLISDGHPTPTAQKYRNKFKYVVLDEFQDTNDFHKRLVDSVTREGTMFTVGDVKQSIFGFINSDISVFIANHRAVANESAGKTISFTENFRSNESVVEFVNWFFERLWENDKEFEFEKLQAKREFCRRKDPDIEFILVPYTDNSKQARQDEAAAIADRIRKMLGLDGGEPLQITVDAASGHTRSVGPGDIMILFRATTEMHIYEKALLEAGIDYYVLGGRGFYSKQEVQDVIAMLRVIENPLNDVAMAQVLRSPMVAVSDDTLWWLTRDAGKNEQLQEDFDDDTDIPARNYNIGKLYNGLIKSDCLQIKSEADCKKIKTFLETLQRLQEIRTATPIYMLIDRILSETNYDLALLASTDGKRKYANILKLLEIAQSLHIQEILSISDFIRYISEIEQLSSREGEAQTETESSPVVKLMSVHKAKGLQSPVVFVADCAHAIINCPSDTFISDKTGQVACKIKGPLFGKAMTNEQYDAICQKLENKGFAEEKRLLYVAMTRAEEKLVLSGFSKYKGDAVEKSFEDIKTWAGWLEKALEITQQQEEEITYMAGHIPVRIMSKPGILPVNTADWNRTTFQKYQNEIISGEKLEHDGPDDLVYEKLDLLKKSSVIPEALTVPLNLSVSQVLDYDSCPAKYYLKWIVGLEEESAEEAEDYPEKENYVSGVTIGSAVHEVLGKLDFESDPEPQLISLSSVYDSEIKGQVEALCREFIDSEWYWRTKNAKNVLQEVAFRVLVGVNSLAGRIDLLIEEDCGWSVVDYKTGAMQEKERYTQQVNLYAYAVQKSLGIAPAQVALVGLGNNADVTFEINDEILDHTGAWLNQIYHNLSKNCYTANVQHQCVDCIYNRQWNKLCNVSSREDN